MKSLAKNSFYNIIYKCLNVVFPLIISAYVSRVLMAEGVGKVSSAQNIVTYFVILAALGLPTYGTKVIAALGKTRVQQSKAFSELFCINTISTCICTIIYYSLVITIPYFQQRQSLSLVCGLAIVFNIINVDWFYQGHEEYGYIMFRSLVIKILSVLAVVIFVKSSDDFVAYAVVLTLSKVANNVFNIVHLRKYASFTLKGLEIKQHIRPVFILLATSIAIEIYTLADTTMLTFINGDTVVGYYTTARKGIDVVRTMLIAVCAVFLPRLSYYYANGEKEEFGLLVNKGVSILTFITIPATVGIILTADCFVPVLFGNDFYSAIFTTQILSFSIITVAYSNFFGYQVLVTIGKEKEMLISTIIGALVNILLNLVLVFSLKHNGVAIASAITELCVAIYQFIIVQKEVVINQNKRFIISIIVGTLVMAVTVLFVKSLFTVPVVSLCVSVISGVIVYSIVTIVLKNTIMIEGINRFLKH